MEIFIYSEIQPGAAEAIRAQLSTITETEEVSIRINSPGGSVTEGFAIASLLDTIPNRIVTHIDGLAASMATIIALKGQEVNMVDGGLFMVHNAGFSTGGNSAQLDAKSKIVKGLSDTMRNIYVARTGMPKQVIQAMMDSETHLTAKEAKKAGFVDNVTKALKAVAVIDINNDMELKTIISNAAAALTGKKAEGTEQDAINALAEAAQAEAVAEVAEEVKGANDAASAITAELVKNADYLQFKTLMTDFVEAVSQFIEETPNEDKRNEEIKASTESALTTLLMNMKKKVEVPVASGHTVLEEAGNDIFTNDKDAEAVRASQEAYERRIQSKLNN